jgi:hypothetical protein
LSFELRTVNTQNSKFKTQNSLPTVNYPRSTVRCVAIKLSIFLGIVGGGAPYDSKLKTQNSKLLNNCQLTAMVQKRYTPPTCTLEITAKSSPLSRWAGQPVFKSVSFELRLDDPRLPDSKHVTLKGDRAQLEALHEAVSNYVQNFLCQEAPPSWETSFTAAASQTIAETASPSIARNTVVLDAPPNPQETATSEANSIADSVAKTAYLPIGPRLQPRGLLAHDLFLGSLSSAESSPVVHLSALQLFDLAAALDECAAEVMAVPNLDRPDRRESAVPWLSIAAMVVATVGLSAGIIKMLDLSGTAPQTASAPTSGQQQLAAGTGVAPFATPTAAPTAAPKAAPKATPTAAPALPPLPPPPINLAPSPSPGLPPVPLATTPSSNRPSPIQQPPLLFPDRNSAPSSEPSAPPPPREQVITIPAPAEEPSISATSKADRAAPAPYVLPPVPPRLAPAVPPPLPPLMPPLAASGVPDRQQPAASRIGPIAPPASTELPRLEDAQPQAESGVNQQAAASKPNRSLFNTIPQVDEVKAYFEERWKPPEGMEETLEYSLQIDEKGSIQTITPMGKAAGDYIDRTNMPLVGEPFVSAVADGTTPRIRVVLRPNGRVQTFLETAGN